MSLVIFNAERLNSGGLMDRYQEKHIGNITFPTECTAFVHVYINVLIRVNVWIR